MSGKRLEPSGEYFFFFLLVWRKSTKTESKIINIGVKEEDKKQPTHYGGSKISHFFFLHSGNCFVALKKGESFESPKRIGCFVFLYESTLILMIFGIRVPWFGTLIKGFLYLDFKLWVLFLRGTLVIGKSSLTRPIAPE